MVGLQVLVLAIEVRILVPEPRKNKPEIFISGLFFSFTRYCYTGTYGRGTRG